MTYLAKTALVTLLLATSFAFTEKTDYDFTGTYGVSNNDPSQIELRINTDHSFTYHDYSNLDSKIDVNGTWELKKNTVILKSKQTDAEFHNKWHISKDGHVAKSRKGMTFYSLCKK